MSFFENIAPLSSWGGDKKPLIIAGPCSAETEDQVMQTVRRMVAASEHIGLIRAGVWKPRTRPNSFEGVGAIGLPWVKAAGNAVGLPVSVEVANSGHVELALKNEIDVLWIGARSTVSPFIVQEIADALRGIDIPVMIKNPVNPDLELWLGAIERFTQVGITRIAAIHRGFSTYEKSTYRNPPMWEMPIELRRRHPQIPIIVDPSHMGGTRDLIYPLSQQAMDMGFDGLIIETHINPDKAWSDAKQQVTPEVLGDILRELVVRQPHLEDNEFHTLHELRAKVDRIDDYIIEMLAERMGISEQIGQFKKDHDLAIHQSERWAAIVKRALANGKTGGLTEDFILKLFQQIHNESIVHQGKVMGN
ncbi:MAG: bifunctional 3-deoxy-7-phosphoheptulonate synthase/chorismate mutase type II [Bacteroidetes bacterium]|nr:bifunctional 3-deoxy-7-phosphoheptulonate synthase/chorismate mutase type II [Bacteroidota bacterium]